MYDVKVLWDSRGRCPFEESLVRLDRNTRARIYFERDKFGAGNFGHYRHLGGGLYETKLAYGGGIRIYYGRDGRRLVLLVGCGNKAGQSRDIFAAKRLWNEYLKGGFHEAH